MHYRPFSLSFWLLVIALLLFTPCRARAQVANPCGPGKNCQVNSIKTGAGSATLPSYSWVFDPNTGLFWGGADTLNFTTGGTSRLSIGATGVSTFSGAVTMPTNMLLSLGSSSFYERASGYLATGNVVQWTGVAFGSLPACNAAAAGSLQFNTTDNRLMMCDSTTWRVVTSGPFTAIFNGAPNIATWNATSGLSGGEAVGAHWLGAYYVADAYSVTAKGMVCNVGVVGTGAGNITFKIRNVTDSTDLCTTGNLPCIGTAKLPVVLSCAGTFLTGKTYSVQTAVDGCTTRPTVITCNVLLGL